MTMTVGGQLPITEISDPAKLETIRHPWFNGPMRQQLHNVAKKARVPVGSSRDLSTPLRGFPEKLPAGLIIFLSHFKLNSGARPATHIAMVGRSISIGESDWLTARCRTARDISAVPHPEQKLVAARP